MNKRGQSIIEYVLIAVLVILGIVFMGPYVLRSINAHFKIWDESVQDSFHETLHQTSVNDVPYIPTKCVCQPDTTIGCPTTATGPSGCGSSMAGSQCPGNQLIWNHNCTPPGCDGEPSSYCQDNSCCCSAWVDKGCGSVTCPASGCASAPTTPPSPNDCYLGQQIQGHQCGSDTSIQCVPDPTNKCAPQCFGIYDNASSVPCTNEPQSESSSPPLLSNNGTNIVAADSLTNCNKLPGCSEKCSGLSALANCTYCDPSQSCQRYCKSPLLLDDTGVCNGCIPYFQKVYVGSYRNSNDCSISNLVLYCPSSDAPYDRNQISQNWNGGGNAQNQLDCEITFDPSGVAGLSTVVTTPSTGAIYLGAGAENFNGRDEEDGWDPCSYDVYNYYGGCRNIPPPACFNNPPAGTTFCRTTGKGTFKVNSDLPPRVVTGCSSTNTSCEYVCSSARYHYTGTPLPSCMPNICHGNPPDGSTACTNNLPPEQNNSPYTLITKESNCSAAGSCQAYCNTGLKPSGHTCVADTCGTLPTHATSCPNNTPPQSSPTTAYTLDTSCPGSPGVCQATCNTGYHIKNKSCVANTCANSVPANSTQCNKNPPSAESITYTVVANKAACPADACYAYCGTNYSPVNNACLENCGGKTIGSGTCKITIPKGTVSGTTINFDCSAVKSTCKGGPISATCNKNTWTITGGTCSSS